MSSIYIQEPPTAGKVLLETTAGDLDLELWSREAPRACRRFLQLCADGFYEGSPFNRLLPGFIVQGGGPVAGARAADTGGAGEYKDEFHSRLRFTHRGLLATANGPGRGIVDDQFFLTLGPTPELQNQHTLFGKVTGETIFNLVRLGEGEVGEDERPLYPHRILRAKILNDPFGDIVARRAVAKEEARKEPAPKPKGTRNLNLLSFGGEEEPEEFTPTPGKAKSSHDLLKDPKLASQAVSVEAAQEPVPSKDVQPTAESVREKLASKKRRPPPADTEPDPPSDAYYLGKDDRLAREAQLRTLKREYKQLKKEMIREEAPETCKPRHQAEDPPSNPFLAEFHALRDEYKEKKAELGRGDSREARTLEMLAKFRRRIEDAKDSAAKAPPAAEKQPVSDEDEDLDPDSWLSHPLNNRAEELRLAKDANTKADDWFEITDPRNAMSKRRRGESKK